MKDVFDLVAYLENVAKGFSVFSLGMNVVGGEADTAVLMRHEGFTKARGNTARIGDPVNKRQTMNKSERTLPKGSIPKKLKFEYQPTKSVPGSAPEVDRPSVKVQEKTKQRRKTASKRKSN